MTPEVIGPPHDFALDRFQVEATQLLDEGRSVVVAAPTGSGKTYVAEHAIARARSRGRRAVYTTPIKALSNQKYRDLTAWLGRDDVGLLTGDNSINPDGGAVVMTTEVLRNMLYTEPARLDDVDFVVMDEVHYLQDNYRGPVWEEVIIHLPGHIRLVALSATVSNAGELADWISSVHAPCAAVTEGTRPVRLESSYFVAERHRPRYHLTPVLRKGRPNPEGRRFDLEGGRKGRGDASGRRPKRRWRTPRRAEVIEELDRRRLLPAITFIFSRAGCEDAVRAVRAEGVRLTTDREAERIREIVTQRTSHLTDADRAALDFDRWADDLEAGLAAHHAGVVPLFKETVEELFTAGLLRAVFATETLALGINMPARTVVIEKLSKFTGDHHEPLKPGDYTQLTGRAGRRGIDERGHAIVLWTPFTTFDEVASLARSSSFELRSAFRPTYNMTCHLVRRYSRRDAEALIARSFGQFQADRSIAQLGERRAALRRRLGLDAHEDPSDATSDAAPDAASAAVSDALGALRPGDVVDLDEPVVVLTTSWRRNALLVRVLDKQGVVRELDPEALDLAPVTITTLRLPEPFDPHNESHRVDLVGQLRQVRRSAAAARRRAKKRSASSSPGPWRDAGRTTARRELERIDARIAQRRGRLADRFKAVVGLLTELGYIDRWELTERGRILVGTFHELDLVLVEALLAGHLDGHDPATLAGVVSTFVYEPRSSDDESDAWYPSDDAAAAVVGIEGIHGHVTRLESAYGLPESRAVDAGAFALAHGWTAGGSLADVLDEERLSGGDFVRLMKQVLDVLSQLAIVAPDPGTRRSAAAAVDRIQRGVIDAPVELPAVGSAP